jgi:hypothetical protein
MLIFLTYFCESPCEFCLSLCLPPLTESVAPCEFCLPLCLPPLTSAAQACHDGRRTVVVGWRSSAGPPACGIGGEHVQGPCEERQQRTGEQAAQMPHRRMRGDCPAASSCAVLCQPNPIPPAPPCAVMCSAVSRCKAVSQLLEYTGRQCGCVPRWQVSGVLCIRYEHPCRNVEGKGVAMEAQGLEMQYCV